MSSCARTMHGDISLMQKAENGTSDRSRPTTWSMELHLATFSLAIATFIAQNLTIASILLRSAACTWDKIENSYYYWVCNPEPVVAQYSRKPRHDKPVIAQAHASCIIETLSAISNPVGTLGRCVPLVSLVSERCTAVWRRHRELEPCGGWTSKTL